MTVRNRVFLAMARFCARDRFHLIATVRERAPVPLPLFVISPVASERKIRACRAPSAEFVEVG